MRSALTRERLDRAQTIAEAAAALGIIVPLAIVIIWGSVQCAQFCIVKTNLTTAAHLAARNLAVAYWKNSDVATDRALQESMVLNQIRITNIVNSSSQFTSIRFDTGASPALVSVTVRYTGGSWGLPPFPSPDILGLGSVSIDSSGTHALN